MTRCSLALVFSAFCYCDLKKKYRVSFTTKKKEKEKKDNRQYRTSLVKAAVCSQASLVVFKIVIDVVLGFRICYVS